MRLTDYELDNHFYDHPERIDEDDFDALADKEQERADLRNDDREAFSG